MSEEAFWVAIWRTIGAVVLGLGLTVAGCSSFSTYQYAQLLRSGIDPIAARCGMASVGSEAMCVMRAMKP